VSYHTLPFPLAYGYIPYLDMGKNPTGDDWEISGFGDWEDWMDEWIRQEGKTGYNHMAGEL